MTGRVLAAVDDSPGGLAALRFGVQIAHDLGGVLCALIVMGDGEVREALDHGDTGGGSRAGLRGEARRAAAADAVLRHAAELGRARQVPVEVCKAQGAVADRVLEQARQWGAELVVLGRSREAGVGRPFIGGQTRLVLEFSDVPVLVVPPASR